MDQYYTKLQATKPKGFDMMTVCREADILEYWQNRLLQEEKLKTNFCLVPTVGGSCAKGARQPKILIIKLN